MGAGWRAEELWTERYADPIEDMQSEISADLAVCAINTDWQTRRAIRLALDRMETGEYGLCESCGGPIQPKRLKALPWATKCVACQEAAEQAGVLTAHDRLKGVPPRTPPLTPQLI